MEAQQIDDGSWVVQVEPLGVEVVLLAQPSPRPHPILANIKADIDFDFTANLRHTIQCARAKALRRPPGEVFFDEFPRIRMRPAFLHPSGQLQQLDSWSDLAPHVAKDERRFAYAQRGER